MTTALRTENVTKRFGDLEALAGVSLALPEGARHALIGPNGAGKTTLINVLTGVLPPSAGDVYLGDERVTTLAPYRRVKRGLARTFQITSLLPGLTVLESVAIVVLERMGEGAGTWRAAMRHGEAVEAAQAVLRDVGLDGDAGQLTRTLAYGKQRLLEIALALATRPRILLLDEPAAGIPSSESVRILEAIANLSRETTILFIEHDMNLVFRFAERITVLVAGRILAEGTPEEISRDDRVKAVYLGRSEALPR